MRDPQTSGTQSPQVVGAVSYLNSRPLIDGLDGEVTVRTDVPSRLLELLLDGEVTVALCPTIDYQRAPRPLAIVPVGAIGSDGTTLTVRVFSPVPLASIERVLVDLDSHTSVALLQVVFHGLFGSRPAIEPCLARQAVGGEANGDAAILLIGDKVVTMAPGRDLFPYRLDLGEAWHRMTGLPFVFATWMTLRETDLGAIPSVLERRRLANRERLREIASSHADAHGWPRRLAETYLRSLLRFAVGPRELEAMQLFWTRCHALGLIDEVTPLELYERVES